MGSSAGRAAGPLQYPVPERLIVGGLMNYVYDGPYALLLKLSVPQGLAPGTPLPIRGGSIISLAPRRSAFPKPQIWR
jgi:DsbC/DsbD-like thiol-disulfide interchange protein